MSADKKRTHQDTVKPDVSDVFVPKSWNKGMMLQPSYDDLSEKDKKKFDYGMEQVSKVKQMDIIAVPKEPDHELSMMTVNEFHHSHERESVFSRFGESGKHPELGAWELVPDACQAVAGEFCYAESAETLLLPMFIDPDDAPCIMTISDMQDEMFVNAHLPFSHCEMDIRTGRALLVYHADTNRRLMLCLECVPSHPSGLSQLQKACLPVPLDDDEALDAAIQHVESDGFEWVVDGSPGKMKVVDRVERVRAVKSVPMRFLTYKFIVCSCS